MASARMLESMLSIKRNFDLMIIVAWTGFRSFGFVQNLNVRIQIFRQAFEYGVN